MAKPGTEPEARARRARTLAQALPQAAEPLGFYASLVDLQRAVVAAHPHVLCLPAAFSHALDAEAAADALPTLLKGLLPLAPAPVASAAGALLEEGHADWRHLVHTYWSGERDGEPVRLFIAEALLQPYAEWAARGQTSATGPEMAVTGPLAWATGPHLGTAGPDVATAGPDVATTGPDVATTGPDVGPTGPDVATAGPDVATTGPDVGPTGLRVGVTGPHVGAAFRRPSRAPDEGTCRVCGDRPVVAVLREEAHGARRSLICGFCLTEWLAPRIACLHCGETQFDKLAVYRAEERAGVRVDACDTCRTYLKTIDLTHDATAIPVVDDIATVTLDLWAREQGYHRLRPGLMRL